MAPIEKSYDRSHSPEKTDGHRATTNAQVAAAAIAQREGCSPHKVHGTLSLAFLSPTPVEAARGGRLRGIGVTRLCDMSAEWSRQDKAPGLHVWDCATRTHLCNRRLRFREAEF